MTNCVCVCIQVRDADGWGEGVLMSRPEKQFKLCCKLARLDLTILIEELCEQ